jgi:hypothetical protein
MGRTVVCPLLLILLSTIVGAADSARAAPSARVAQSQAPQDRPQATDKDKDKDKDQDQDQKDKDRKDKGQKHKDQKDKDQKDKDQKDNGKKVRDKEGLTDAERKVDSHLRDEIARRKGVRQPLRTGLRVVEIDEHDRALVEIRARILSQLGRKIERLKGTIISSSLEHRAMLAWVPLAKLETVAEEATVSSIVPAPKSITVRPHGR